ncbi:MAG TPA: hypothetical protein VG405_01085 [Solirubrobacteraceae bacterium]|nr:hypothetical protein [Solirubrobacteraceae bacterium]
MRERPNLHAAEFEYDDEDPPGYRGGAAMISRALGAQEIALKLFELPPGESLCPYHYEYVEEWLLLLAGELDLRTPKGSERLPSGAVVCFPAGPDGAHKVTTPADGSEAARFVMFSSSHEPAVSVYPDSNKIGVWVPGATDNLMLRREDGNVPYYAGETD